MNIDLIRITNNCTEADEGGRERYVHVLWGMCLRAGGWRETKSSLSMMGNHYIMTKLRNQVVASKHVI